MSNGIAALRLVAPELPSQPAATATPDVAAELGELIADLTTCFGQSLIDYESTGAMALSTKWRAGDLFARLYAFQEAALGKFDFEATMYAQGRLALARRYRAAVRRQLCPDLDSAALDTVHDTAIDWIHDVLTKVTRDERARAH